MHELHVAVNKKKLKKKKNDHEGIRTLNLLIRSQTPYPLGHAVRSANGPAHSRTYNSKLVVSWTLAPPTRYTSHAIKILSAPMAMASHELVKALYPYSGGDQAVPLQFASSAILLVAERTADGWCRGFSAGKEGWFPASYVAVLDHATIAQVSRP